MIYEKEGKDPFLALTLLLYLAGYDRTNVNPSRFRGLTEREADIVSKLIDKTDTGPVLNEKGMGTRRRLLGSAITAVSYSVDAGCRYDEIPSSQIVAERLKRLGGHAGAIRLKRSMTDEGWKVPHAEMGIQRAIDAGTIVLARDWSLDLPEN